MTGTVTACPVRGFHGAWLRLHEMLDFHVAPVLFQVLREEPAAAMARIVLAAQLATVGIDRQPPDEARATPMAYSERDRRVNDKE